ncbi:DUF4156 domain-containing protein [Vibrio sp. JPW-9-11-11]|uniref:DUF4156 domain-containing protein n=1 Tax=Vibrio sp. JPW-9-11-11 TaxID=1416532 RepID=UPI0015945E57|nr:DUF4156 domain-containing protein [Vibrio sp. JPW-9-11-11]NVD06117.1 DUF4156 domain-containing protein [Vibrio sp. JPW-9-11-11]
MSVKIKSLLVLTISGALVGCVTPDTLLEPAADQVHLRMDSQFNPEQCQWLGEVTGSEGHWYSYLFFPNDSLVQGALNDIKNRAHNLGANTVSVNHSQNFVTSFTLMGSAYSCPPPE